MGISFYKIVFKTYLSRLRPGAPACAGWREEEEQGFS